MSSEIENLLSHLNRFVDVAKSDRFLVFFGVPPIMTTLGGGVIGSIVQLLPLQCEAAGLPGRSFASFEARTYGPNIKYPYQSIFGDVSLTFFCVSNPSGSTGAGLYEKRFFDEWMEQINPSTQDTNIARGGFYNFNYKDDYVTTITVEHYDTQDNIDYGIELIDAFPLDVSSVPLSWQDDSVMRVTVTLAYTRWQLKGTNNSPVSIPAIQPGSIDSSQVSTQPSTRPSTLSGGTNTVTPTLDSIPPSQDVNPIDTPNRSSVGAPSIDSEQSFGGGVSIEQLD